MERRSDQDHYRRLLPACRGWGFGGLTLRPGTRVVKRRPKLGRREFDQSRPSGRFAGSAGVGGNALSAGSGLAVLSLSALLYCTMNCSRVITPFSGGAGSPIL